MKSEVTKFHLKMHMFIPRYPKSRLYAFSFFGSCIEKPRTLELQRF